MEWIRVIGWKIPDGKNRRFSIGKTAIYRVFT
jgi:hypothetical protein